MAKCELISVVEDDQPFRESMRKLMIALGYAVEAFPSAADFLASPLLPATACLTTVAKYMARRIVVLRSYAEYYNAARTHRSNV
jgi:FixJ family two-component response regulator